MEKNKIEEKDLAQIRSNQAKRDEMLLALGELELQKSKIIAALHYTEKENIDLKTLLKKKYGDIAVNVKTGELTPRE
jgi:hypothetical protein